MPIELQYPLIISGVARATGLSNERIRQLDPELAPIRTQSGQRRYSVESVQRFLEQRAAR